MGRPIKCPECGNRTKKDDLGRICKKGGVEWSRRYCAFCGCMFYHKPSSDIVEVLTHGTKRAKSMRCTLSDSCPYFKYCVDVDNAQRCATFRAVIMRRMPTLRD